jgi:hypothetical protein
MTYQYLSMRYDQLDKQLEERGYPFGRSAMILGEVADEYRLTDPNGDVVKPFSPLAIEEVYRRLGPAPKRSGRPAIGPEVKTKLAPEEIEALENWADTLGVGRSALIRDMLRSYVYGGYCVPPQPKEVSAVIDMSGMPWVASAGRRWTPVEAGFSEINRDRDWPGYSWAELVIERGGLTPCSMEYALAWDPKDDLCVSD